MSTSKVATSAAMHSTMRRNCWAAGKGKDDSAGSSWTVQLGQACPGLWAASSQSNWELASGGSDTSM